MQEANFETKGVAAEGDGYSCNELLRALSVLSDWPCVRWKQPVCNKHVPQYGSTLWTGPCKKDCTSSPATLCSTLGEQYTHQLLHSQCKYNLLMTRCQCHEMPQSTVWTAAVQSTCSQPGPLSPHHQAQQPVHPSPAPAWADSHHIDAALMEEGTRGS